MQKAQTHAKKHRTNPILLLVILALVVFLGVELIRVGKRLNEAAQQQAAGQQQAGFPAIVEGDLNPAFDANINRQRNAGGRGAGDLQTLS